MRRIEPNMLVLIKAILCIGMHYGLSNSRLMSFRQYPKPPAGGGPIV